MQWSTAEYKLNPERNTNQYRQLKLGLPLVSNTAEMRVILLAVDKTHYYNNDESSSDG